MSASPEFVSLCRSQVALVTRGLGASLGAVYLTEELAESLERHLVPIVVYPETERSWSQTTPLSLPAAIPQELPAVGLNNDPSPPESSLPALPQLKPQQMVLPLIHTDLVMGLLVVGRDDRQWQDWERTQLEEIAHTLAIARFLDQRSQWLEHITYDQRSLQGQQQDTLANLLHQFRNPLTTLRTLGKLLLKRLQPQDHNRSIATSIIQESDRLQDMLYQFDQVVEDLGEAALDLESDAVTVAANPPLPRQLPPAPNLLLGSELALMPCSVAATLQPSLESAAAVAEERNLELQTQVPLTLPPVQANPQALREVYSNLIDNALKYTPSGGKIRVEVRREQSEAGAQQLITVVNTGPGIPPQDLEHLFERHYRGVQVHTGISGTGLGLAIARHLVKQMGGEIQVFSPASPAHPSPTGPGVRFVVRLPEA